MADTSDTLDTNALRLAAMFRLGRDIADRLETAAAWQLKQAEALNAAADEIDRLRAATPLCYAIVLEGEYRLDVVYGRQRDAEAVAAPFRDAGRRVDVVPLYAREGEK